MTCIHKEGKCRNRLLNVIFLVNKTSWKKDDDEIVL